MKELGLWTLANLGENVSGLSMALLTGKGWTREKVEVWSARVRKDFRDRRIRGFFEVYSPKLLTFISDSIT
jgi:hypothetical protein